MYQVVPISFQLTLGRIVLDAERKKWQVTEGRRLCYRSKSRVRRSRRLAWRSLLSRCESCALSLSLLSVSTYASSSPAYARRSQSRRSYPNARLAPWNQSQEEWNHGWLAPIGVSPKHPMSFLRRSTRSFGARRTVLRPTTLDGWRQAYSMVPAQLGNGLAT